MWVVMGNKESTLPGLLQLALLKEKVKSPAESAVDEELTQPGVNKAANSEQQTEDTTMSPEVAMTVMGVSLVVILPMLVVARVVSC